MPRFVVLRHEAPRGLHYDLMLEDGAVLATWALAGPPETLAEQPAERLADHRREYLDYEGPVSGDRGVVTRHDTGTFTIVTRRDGQWHVAFCGGRLRGVGTLTLSTAAPNEWRWEHT